MLADKLFTKASQSLKTSQSGSNNLCAKLVSSSELSFKFDEKFKVTSVPFFIPEINY